MATSTPELQQLNQLFEIPQEPLQQLTLPGSPLVQEESGFDWRGALTADPKNLVSPQIYTGNPKDVLAPDQVMQSEHPEDNSQFSGNASDAGSQYFDAYQMKSKPAFQSKEIQALHQILAPEQTEEPEPAPQPVVEAALKQTLADHAADMAKEPIKIDPITGKSQLWSYITAANKAISKPAVIQNDEYERYQEIEQAEHDNYVNANKAIREVNLQQQHPDEYLKQLFGYGDPYAFTKAEPSLGQLPSLVPNDPRFEGLDALHRLKKHLEL